ncbi:MAG: SAM-dependent chlorinase/fluorinase [Candidatus Omnitrophica bacterium]|nr:SAM-dependent chlorinase/fluorinase [Candidatus Omnitrophota bacterium]
MAERRVPLIALLTDFGTREWYVACLKAVILSRCPTAALIDITHEIPPQNIAAAALTLSAAAPWFPPSTIFVCVVDPGVGTARPLLAAHADGRYYIGPDNGTLGLVLEQARTRRLVRLTVRRFWLPERSRTFHGRDIMAPVAAGLARGLALERLGPCVREFQPAPIPAPQRSGRAVHGSVVHIDRFGNAITNLPSTLLTDADRVRIRIGRRQGRVVSSYGEGQADELIALAGSVGLIELAVRDGSAAEVFGVRAGHDVTAVMRPSAKTRGSTWSRAPRGSTAGR